MASVDERKPKDNQTDGPIGFAKRAIAWVMGLRPVRVFQHFGVSNGAILAGGMSYQAIFAVFAAIWVGFSIAGLWLTSNPALTASLFDILNQSIPGLIGDEGVIDPDDLLSAGVFGWTGAIALIGLLATALGWLSTTAQAVRTIFRMPQDSTFFVLAKLRELGLGVLFGLALVVSALVSLASTEALGALFNLFGQDDESVGFTITARIVGLLIVLLIDTVTLATLFRVLSRVRIPRRRLIGGALLGAVALGILKILGSLLLGGAGNNPLLATFAVIIGLLIWFNLMSTVTLLAASWIAVGMNDAGISPRSLSTEQVEAEQEAREAAAVRLAAEVELRDAEAARTDAPWYGRLAAGRRVRAAKHRLDELGRRDSLAGQSDVPAALPGNGDGATDAGRAGTRAGV